MLCYSVHFATMKMTEKEITRKTAKIFVYFQVQNDGNVLSLLTAVLVQTFIILILYLVRQVGEVGNAQQIF